MQRPSMINPEWASNPPWNELPEGARQHLEQFLVFMRDPRSFPSGKALSEFTIVQYWTRIRLFLSSGDMLSVLDKPGSKAAKATDRQAIAVWAAYIGGEEGELLKDKIRRMKAAAKEVGPRGGVAPREDKLAISTDDWIRLRERAERDRDAKALAVQILLRSSLRIGDVLLIRRVAVEKGLQGGSMPTVLKESHTISFPVDPIRRQLAGLLRFELWETVQDLLGGSYYAATKRIRRRLQDYSDELGIEGVTPHILRHTMLTYLAHGESTATAQALAGHASPVTTARYTRRPPSTKALGDAMMRVLGEEARDAG